MAACRQRPGAARQPACGLWDVSGPLLRCVRCAALHTACRMACPGQAFLPAPSARPGAAAHGPSLVRLFAPLRATGYRDFAQMRSDADLEALRVSWGWQQARRSAGSARLHGPRAQRRPRAAWRAGVGVRPPLATAASSARAARGAAGRRCDSAGGCATRGRLASCGCRWPPAGRVHGVYSITHSASGGCPAHAHIAAGRPTL